ncbi:MAG: hypothetical protein ABSF45_26345 [Terriglobia bacterium]|jgi:hypothetical protein
MTGHHLITPTHRSIRKYYDNVAALRAQGVLNEMSVRSPFESLLQETARLKDWAFVAELSGKSGGAVIRPDGTLRDSNKLPRGYWEAKDTQDDLDTEIKKKIARGYPLSNIIFEDTQTGVLFQGKQKINGPYGLGNPKELAALLNQFFSYTEPDIEDSCGLTSGTVLPIYHWGGSLEPTWVKREHPVRPFGAQLE